MWKRVALLFLIVFLCGCNNRQKDILNEDVSINYPVTNISVLDDEISGYINKVYLNFKSMRNTDSKLNISYIYKELNEDIINVCINSEIKIDKTIHKVKTFTFNKKNNTFLTMEDIIQDVDVLNYDIKKLLLQKYQDINIEYLSSVSLSDFKIDDDNLTIYFNEAFIKNNNKVIYLDIPLNSVHMLIDIDTDFNNSYISIKQKNIDLDDKFVAITFDDGPSKYTDKILDILKKYNVSATFFVVGEKAYFQGETLRRMIRDGCEIGNHSYSHKRLNNLSENEFIDEINKTQEVIKNLTGFTPSLFRPTYGGYTKRLMGYTDLIFVLWDVDSKDWLVRGKEKILKNVIPNVKSGSIILMHDNHEYSLNSLEAIITDLKDKGYKFVTVSELLKINSIRENE